MRRADLVFMALVIAALAAFGCATARQAIQTATERAMYPTTIAATDAEIQASTERLDVARTAREAFVKWTVTSDLEESKFAVQSLKAMDENIAAAEEWIIRMEAHRQSLEAQAIQRQIDAAP